MLKLLVTEFLFIIAICLIKSGGSLKCYACRSDLNENCDDIEKESNWSVECPQNAKFCRKVKQLLRFREDNDYHTFRECGFESEKECYFEKQIQLAYQETCECGKDLCNSGPSYYTNYLILSFTIASSILLCLRND